jgi:hypothetical protein
MNDLNLIGFEKPKWNFKLFLYVIVFMFTAYACNQRKTQSKSTNAKIMIDSLPKIPTTYIEKIESEDRQKWFDDNKYPILDLLTMKQEGSHENKGLDFLDIRTAINFFKPLTSSLQSDDGILVYFASPASDGTVNKGKCGKLTLIFVVTRGAERKEVLPYYAFNNKTFIPIDSVNAKKGIHNYQLIKRDSLFKTLSYQDRFSSCKETKHVWFSFEQMEQTVKEMEYQSQKPGNKIDGFGIRFVSYTDQVYTFRGSKPPKYKLEQRLTIGFTFIKNDADIGIEELDPIEFKERLKITGPKFLSSTFDTGFPAPPPPGNESMAALDIEN